MYAHGSPAQFSPYVHTAFHRESDAVYRFCKSYTVMKIHTSYSTNMCILCT